MQAYAMWHQESKLFIAIQNSDLRMAENLLQSGVDADVRFKVGPEKRPAICICVERGHFLMAELLLKHGCSINQSDPVCGFTALHIAALYGHVEVVKLLLKNGSNVKVLSSVGQTPLHLACQQNSLEIVKMLVDSGSEIEKKDYDERTPLSLAAARGYIDIVQYLVLKGANVNSIDYTFNTPLMYAVSGPHSRLGLVTILLNAGAKVNFSNKVGETPLLSLIRCSKQLPDIQISVGILMALIESGCNINFKTTLGQSPLHLAIVLHQDHLIEKLARCGCDLNTRDTLGLSPLFHLAKDGKAQLIKLLVALGVNLSKETWINDTKRISEVSNLNLQDWILEQKEMVPLLKSKCRIVIRNYLGIKADSLILELNLPVAIKNYLRLAQL